MKALLSQRPVGAVVEDIRIGARDIGFASRADQNKRSVASAAMFFWSVVALSRGDGPQLPLLTPRV